MLNRMQIEGVVLKTWTYAGNPFARMVNRPDPGIDQGDILFIAKLPATVPMGLRPGDLLRMHGRFFNRRKDDGDDRHEPQALECLQKCHIQGTIEQIPCSLGTGTSDRNLYVIFCQVPYAHARIKRKRSQPAPRLIPPSVRQARSRLIPPFHPRAGPLARQLPQA